MNLPTNGEFKCILADPPWAFRTYVGLDLVPARGKQPYSTMSLADLRKLPIAECAAKDCLLFMWTVSYLQPQSFELAAAWGFKHVSVAFIWDKRRIGMGYWTRQEAEICHLFKRGKPPRLSSGVHQMIREPRREHSRKPDSQYERIEALCGGPRLELFARQSRNGWHAWGNQTGLFQPANDSLFSEEA